MGIVRNNHSVPLNEEETEAGRDEGFKVKNYVQFANIQVIVSNRYQSNRALHRNIYISSGLNYSPSKFIC